MHRVAYEHGKERCKIITNIYGNKWAAYKELISRRNVLLERLSTLFLDEKSDSFWFTVYELKEVVKILKEIKGGV